jgi:release factor glutamine methyltransferase
VKAPAGPTRREARAGAAAELRQVGIDSPEHEAERLLAHVLDIEPGRLVLELDARLTADEAGAFARAVSRRLTREPLQHIEGEVHFRHLRLKSDTRALIPRPETEQLVEIVVGWLAGRTLDVALDIGTGTGAIAASLVAEGIAARAVATEVSPAAMELAAENLDLLGLADRVELRSTSGPVWEPIRDEERFGCIVSNPPYVSEAESRVLPPEVADFDPREALVGGAGGLDLIDEISAGAAPHLEPGGALFLEIGATQGLTVRHLFDVRPEWRRVLIQRDLAGLDRFVRAEPR